MPEIEALTMAEVDAGIRFWLAAGWPADFHDAAYRRFADENRDRFSAAWWEGFMEPALIRWQALRGLRGFTRARLRANFEAHADEMRQLWSQLTEVVGDEIDNTEWEDVRTFTEVVAQLKPTTSPVLTSKFCHFQLPKVFPIVDNWAMGGSRSYAAHFALVQGVWTATAPKTRRSLINRLRTEIGTGSYDGYPWTNKVVELGLIGRRQLARSR